MIDNHKRLLYNTLRIISALVFTCSTCLFCQINPIAPTETVHPADSTQLLLTGQRVMQTFDFEERDVHLDDLPMYWQQVPPRPGFPHYAGGILDNAVRRSGKYSFKLISDGGSVGFQYHRRRIPVKPGSDFQVTGYVYLKDMITSRVQISCSLTDRRGQEIPGSRHTSMRIGPREQFSGGWTRMEVYVPGNFPEARFLTIGLWLLQEEQWRQDMLNTTLIFRPDVKAVAWFDDITIHQLPRVILCTNKLGNVFDGDEEAQLEVEVEGVSSLDYQIRLNVFDAHQEPIHNESWILTGLADKPKARTIPLPNLSAGIYNTRLSIMSGTILVSTRHLTFAKLASLSGTPAGSGLNFGILALDENIGDWDTVLELTRLSNAKLLKLPVWRRRSDAPGAIFSTPDFDRKLMRLQQSNVQVMAAFSEIPDTLAAKLSPDRRTLLDLLSQDPELWRPQLAFVLAQYARQIPYWQIGADTRAQKQSWDPRIRSVVDSMHAEFAKLVSQTVLAVPLSGMFQVNQAQVGTHHVALGIPSAVVPEHIPAYLEDSRRRDLNVIWANVETLDPKQHARNYRIIDFAKRVAYAKKGGAQAVFTDHPWTQRLSNGRMVTEPTELFLVYRTLSDQLGGTEYIGQFDLAPDIHALIFDREASGCLFVWNDNYNPEIHPEQAQLEYYLGDAPLAVDLFGNLHTLPSENGLTKLRVTNWPIMINGVNTRLAHLRSTVHLDPQVVEASIYRQTAKFKFTNPFQAPISGRVRFIRTEQHHQNWLIDPVAYNFTLRPGEAFERDLTLKFPRNEVGGKKRLHALFTLDADRPYRFIQAIPFEIQLTGVELSIFTRRAGATDLLVQMVVTNTSDQEMALQSFIDLPDRDRLERAIPHLPPGITVTKTYRIPNAVQWVGQNIRLGLYDPKGTKRINHHLEIN
jgi:hypothetical protein